MNKIYVMPKDNKWAVKRNEEDKPIDEKDTKKEAIEAAKEIAIGLDASLVVLRRDGTIENLGQDSVDPFPDEDKGPDYNNFNDEGV